MSPISAISPGAGGWGCESTTQAGKYITSIETDDIGNVKMNLGGAKITELGFAATDTPAIYFIVLQADGTDMATLANAILATGKQVGGMKCVVPTTDTQMVRIAPGSCTTKVAPAAIGGTWS